MKTKFLDFRTIFDQAAIGLAYIESKTGKFIKVNEKFCDIVGIQIDAALKKTFMAITHPEDLQADLDNMDRLINGEIREFSMEKRYIQSNGLIIWGNLTVSALWNIGEDPDYHIAVVEDITEHKLAQDQLKTLNILLEDCINKRTDELQKNTKALSETIKLLQRKELELTNKDQGVKELNIALKVLINQKENTQLALEEKVLQTMGLLVEPYLEKLEKICSDPLQKNYILFIKKNLKDIISPFCLELSSRYLNLSKTEIKVSDLIRQNQNNSKISKILNISITTVAAHRKNIRKKLGLTNTKTNLKSHLLTLK